jgi:hypothetical protein
MVVEDLIVATVESDARVLCIFLLVDMVYMMMVYMSLEDQIFTLTCSNEVRKEVKRYVLQKGLHTP